MVHGAKWRRTGNPIYSHIGFPAVEFFSLIACENITRVSKQWQRASISWAYFSDPNLFPETIINNHKQKQDMNRNKTNKFR